MPIHLAILSALAIAAGACGGGQDRPTTSASSSPEQEYAVALKGRILAAWKPPPRDAAGGEVVGCVKLDREGQIVDRGVARRSGNADLDRSVEQALNDATGMDQPVPSALVEVLTTTGICFSFTAEEAR